MTIIQPTRTDGKGQRGIGENEIPFQVFPVTKYTGDFQKRRMIPPLSSELI